MGPVVLPGSQGYTPLVAHTLGELDRHPRHRPQHPMTAPQCPHCGAPMTDLAAANCGYCSGALYAAAGPNVTLQGLAAATSQDAAAVERALPQLAAQLQAALPGMVRVDTASHGLLKKTTTVRAIHASVGDQRFIVEATAKGAFRAQICHEVRDVVLSHREVGVAEWLATLQAELARRATSQQGTSAALTRLLGS
jgi:hypothetical protein